MLDTDTYNEVDDQFTLAYACLSPAQVKLEACYAAPFHNARSSGPADGMEKSYREIHHVLELVGTDLGGRVFRGATRWLGAGRRPVESEAVTDLISRAMDDSQPGPLHVVGIAAATNLASALLLEPRIAQRVRMVWLGGHPYDWPTADEFNLRQDVPAAQVLFESDVPMLHVPCKNVAEHLITTAADLREHLPPDQGLGDFLRQRFDLYLTQKGFQSKPLWDVLTVAVLINPGWAGIERTSRPRLTDDKRWQRGTTGEIDVVMEVKRDAIFQDLYRKLKGPARVPGASHGTPQP
ncbi:MAG: nucleoside hydrolase [Candidatus Didemnitutus sp.]|nr:nucleoside hydrolase [Candidatus Didemnitutus sp.]